ncbi:MAG TPA: dihydrodipicolinate synthase family protein [Roseiflexaceae bacterium]|nr:dihydrodipicolinate synthase family protein [Roseiflexaceae bacterium]HMP39126.1 dihydrodipicolinate synthase family protein [Roseiflexaceae bacterium]
MPRYPQAVLVSCEIPWDDREQLLEEAFRSEVRHTLAAGFNHLYIFGTAGEGYAVDLARFRQIVSIFAEETRAPGVWPMVGVIALSTATVVERLTIAYEAGFRVFQISLPSWGALNDTEVLTFFRDVCGTFPDAQFLHYNLPRAKRILGGADYRRLIDAVPNLVATKNTGGGLARAADLMANAAELQHFFGEENFPHGCMFGECSLLSSVGVLAPQLVNDFFAAGRTRDLARLFTYQHEFMRFFGEVFAPISGERIDGTYDKAIVRLSGMEAMPLRLLSPYQGMSDAEFDACRRIFYERFADWISS